MKKPIPVAEVKVNDFVRLGNDGTESHGGYVTATGTDGPYATLTIDDGDRVSTARFEAGATVWLVIP